MTSLNKKLVIAAGVLLVLSGLTHWNSVSRADRFERGQKLLSNLNPDEIAAIEITSAEGTVTLNRQGDGYTVAEENGYRARNEGVNRFVRNLLDVTLTREIGEGDALAEELGLGSGHPDGIEVALKSSADTDMVRLEVGSAADDGDGTYVRRKDGEDQAIYLTESTLRLDSKADQFLNKELVDYSSSSIASIRGADFVFASGEDGLALQGVPAGQKEKTAEVAKVTNLLSRLRYDKVYLADDEQVRDLAFAQTLRYELEDGSGYEFQVANKDDKAYFRIVGFHTVERVEIQMDTSEEELEEKADVLNRAEDIQEFNDFHGSWVYEVDSFTGDKLGLRKSDLTEAS